MPTYIHGGLPAGRPFGVSSRLNLKTEIAFTLDPKEENGKIASAGQVT
jgi:hypothetical protein